MTPQERITQVLFSQMRARYPGLQIGDVTATMKSLRADAAEIWADLLANWQVVDLAIEEHLRAETRKIKQRRGSPLAREEESRP